MRIYFFSRFASCICKKLNDTKYSLNENWSEIANNIRLLYNATLNYNPQYEGYNLSIPIKQADVVLLGYPLQYANIDGKTQLNNLKLYKNVTKPNGPPMLWSMHAIGYLSNGLTPTGRLFNRTYAPYIRKPFYVWNASGKNAEPGISNFLSGAGGFLQLIMYGYAGIRIKTDSMTITNPTLPPRTRKLTLNSMS